MVHDFLGNFLTYTKQNERSQTFLMTVTKLHPSVVKTLGLIERPEVKANLAHVLKRT